MKILAVCGMGVSSALLLCMLVEKALENPNLQTELQIAEIGTARGPCSHADIIATSAELAERLSQIKGRTVTVNHYTDVNEMTEKLPIALSQDT